MPNLFSSSPRLARSSPPRWSALLRRLGRTLAILLTPLALSGCLVSKKIVDLGPRAQPLPAGLYVSFDDQGAPEHAVVMRLKKDGRYDHEDFQLAFYESGIAPHIYFIAYYDDEQNSVLYGVAAVEDNAISYPGVTCSMVPDETLSAAGVDTSEDGCVIASAEQGRAVLTAVWRSLTADGDPNTEEWERFVRQTAFSR